MKNLISPISSLKGCQINFPETIFINDSTGDSDDGVVEFLALNDKDGCIRIVTDKEKLRLYK